MRCINCGKEIDVSYGMVMCPYCGRILDDKIDKTDYENAYNEFSNEREELKKNNKDNDKPITNEFNKMDDNTKLKKAIVGGLATTAFAASAGSLYAANKNINKSNKENKNKTFPDDNINNVVINDNDEIEENADNILDDDLFDSNDVTNEEDNIIVDNNENLDTNNSSQAAKDNGIDYNPNATPSKPKKSTSKKVTSKSNNNKNSTTTSKDENSNDNNLNNEDQIITDENISENEQDSSSEETEDDIFKNPNEDDDTSNNEPDIDSDKSDENITDNEESNIDTSEEGFENLSPYPATTISNNTNYTNDSSYNSSSFSVDYFHLENAISLINNANDSFSNIVSLTSDINTDGLNLQTSVASANATIEKCFGNASGSKVGVSAGTASQLNKLRSDLQKMDPDYDFNYDYYKYMNLGYLSEQEGWNSDEFKKQESSLESSLRSEIGERKKEYEGNTKKIEFLDQVIESIDIQNEAFENYYKNLVDIETFTAVNQYVSDRMNDSTIPANSTYEKYIDEKVQELKDLNAENEKKYNELEKAKQKNKNDINTKNGTENTSSEEELTVSKYSDGTYAYLDEQSLQLLQYYTNYKYLNACNESNSISSIQSQISSLETKLKMNQDSLNSGIVYENGYPTVMSNDEKTELENINKKLSQEKDDLNNRINQINESFESILKDYYDANAESIYRIPEINRKPEQKDFLLSRDSYVATLQQKDLRNEIQEYQQYIEDIQEEIDSLSEKAAGAYATNVSYNSSEYSGINYYANYKAALKYGYGLEYLDEKEQARYKFLLETVSSLEEKSAIALDANNKLEELKQQLIMQRSDYSKYSNFNNIKVENGFFGGLVFRDATTNEKLDLSKEEQAVILAMKGSNSTNGTVNEYINYLKNGSENLSYDALGVIAYNMNKSKEFEGYDSNFASSFDYLYDQGARILGKQMADEFTTRLDNCPDIFDWVLVADEALEDGLTGFFRGFKNIFCADGRADARDYKPMFITDYINNSDQYCGLYKTILTSEYEITNSIGNMLPSMLVTLIPVVGPAVGLISLGVSAAGNAREQGLQQGMSQASAWMYGVLSGASEALLEKFLGGIPGLSDMSNVVGVHGLARIFKAGCSEAREEMLQEFLDPIFKFVSTGGEIRENISVENILKAGIYAFITAGILNGGNVAFEGVSYRLTGDYLALGTLASLNTNSDLSIKENIKNFLRDLNEFQNRDIKSLEESLMENEEVKAAYEAAKAGKGDLAFNDFVSRIVVEQVVSENNALSQELSEEIKQKTKDLQDLRNKNIDGRYNEDISKLESEINDLTEQRKSIYDNDMTIQDSIERAKEKAVQNIDDLIRRNNKHLAKDLSEVSAENLIEYLNNTEITAEKIKVLFDNISEEKINKILEEKPELKALLEENSTESTDASVINHELIDKFKATKNYAEKIELIEQMSSEEIVQLLKEDSQAKLVLGKIKDNAKLADVINKSNSEVLNSIFGPPLNEYSDTTTQLKETLKAKLKGQALFEGTINKLRELGIEIEESEEQIETSDDTTAEPTSEIVDHHDATTEESESKTLPKSDNSTESTDASVISHELIDKFKATKNYAEKIELIEQMSSEEIVQLLKEDSQAKLVLGKIKDNAKLADVINKSNSEVLNSIFGTQLNEYSDTTTQLKETLKEKLKGQTLFEGTINKLRELGIEIEESEKTSHELIDKFKATKNYAEKIELIEQMSSEEIVQLLKEDSQAKLVLGKIKDNAKLADVINKSNSEVLNSIFATQLNEHSDATTQLKETLKAKLKGQTLFEGTINKLRELGIEIEESEKQVEIAHDITTEQTSEIVDHQDTTTDKAAEETDHQDTTTDKAAEETDHQDATIKPTPEETDHQDATIEPTPDEAGQQDATIEPTPDEAEQHDTIIEPTIEDAGQHDALTDATAKVDEAHDVVTDAAEQVKEAENLVDSSSENNQASVPPVPPIVDIDSNANQSPIKMEISEFLAKYKGFKNIYEFKQKFSSLLSQWESSLTAREISLIENYTGNNEMEFGNYATVNSILRGIFFNSQDGKIHIKRIGGDEDSYTFSEFAYMVRSKYSSAANLSDADAIKFFVRGQIQAINDLSNAISKFELPEDILLERRIGGSSLVKLFNIDINNDSVEDVVRKINDGGYFRDNGFMSTSAGKSPGYGNVVLKLGCKAGMSAVDITGNSKYSVGENEVLVNIGTTFRAVNAERVNGRLVIYLESIPANNIQVDSMDSLKTFISDNINASPNSIAKTINNYFEQQMKNNASNSYLKQSLYYDLLEISGMPGIDQTTMSEILSSVISNNKEMRSIIYEMAQEEIKQSFKDTLDIQNDADIKTLTDFILGESFVENGVGNQNWDGFFNFIYDKVKESVAKSAKNKEAILWSKLPTIALNQMYSTIENTTLGDTMYFLDLVYSNWNSQFSTLPPLEEFWGKMSKLYAEACSNLKDENGNPITKLKYIYPGQDAIGELFKKEELPTLLEKGVIKTLEVVKANVDETNPDLPKLTNEKTIEIDLTELSNFYRKNLNKGVSKDILIEKVYSKFIELLHKGGL